MKRVLTGLVLSAAIGSTAGCAGVVYSRNGDVVSGKEPFPFASRYAAVPPERAADRANADGTETYVMQDEIKWCGLTVFAVIPVPLWLPVCRSRTEFTYKDDQLTLVQHQSPEKTGFVCGPLMRFTGALQADGWCVW